MSIEQQSLYLVTAGEYSDYNVLALMMGPPDIPLAWLLEQYLAEHPEQKIKFKFQDQQFLAYVIDRTGLKDVDYQELYLGDYHCHEGVRFFEGNSNDPA